MLYSANLHSLVSSPFVTVLQPHRDCWSTSPTKFSFFHSTFPTWSSLDGADGSLLWPLTSPSQWCPQTTTTWLRTNVWNETSYLHLNVISFSFVQEKDFVIYFYFMCMYVHHMHAVPVEARTGCQVLWNRVVVSQQVSTDNKLRSLARAAVPLMAELFLQTLDYFFCA